MADQVAAQVRANMARPGQQLVIRLNPPELGQVRLRLHAEGNDLTGELKVDNPQTLEQLRAESPALVRQLADSGVQVRRLDISLTDQHLQDESNWLGREGQRQEQHESGDWHDPRLLDAGGHEEPDIDDPDAGPRLAESADGSVNLWI